MFILYRLLIQLITLTSLKITARPILAKLLLRNYIFVVSDLLGVRADALARKFHDTLTPGNKIVCRIARIESGTTRGLLILVARLTGGIEWPTTSNAPVPSVTATWESLSPSRAGDGPERSAELLICHSVIITLANEGRSTANKTARVTPARLLARSSKPLQP